MGNKKKKKKAAVVGGVRVARERRHVPAADHPVLLPSILAGSLRAPAEVPFFQHEPLGPVSCVRMTGATQGHPLR
jgi:hypothetical protein